MEEVKNHFPEVLEWVKTCYGQPSHLQFCGITISSSRGFHQGDPLAGLLFSLVLQPVINHIQRRVPAIAVNAWFLDDGTQVGTISQLKTVVDILTEEGPARGLLLSTAATVPAQGRPKTTVWSPQAQCVQGDPVDRGLVRVEGERVTLLGAPLGSEEFVGREVEKKV